MATKTIRRMEFSRGFIKIPSVNRFDLIGNAELPRAITLNGNEARIDKYGRIWSPSLKRKYDVGTTVEITKTDQNYQISPIANCKKQELLGDEQIAKGTCFSNNEETKATVTKQTIQVTLVENDNGVVRKSGSVSCLGAETKVVFRELVKLPSTTYGTFGLYRYPAKFIPQVISYVLEKYAKPKSNIFDPFAGYGTVGIVSRIYDCNYELWDLNPLLETFHAIATLDPKNVDSEEIIRKLGSSQEEFVPDWSRLDYWYPKEFLPFLYKIWGFYHSLDDEYLKLLITIPLLKVTRYYSLDDMQRQKLSQSPVSERRMVSLLTADWERKFYKMLKWEINKVIEGVANYSTFSPKKTTAKIRAGVDIMATRLDEEKNMLITSPPYLQSQEYMRQAKIDLFWLGYSESKVRELHKLEIPYRDVEARAINSDTFCSFRDSIAEDHLRRVFNRYFWGVLGALTNLQENVSDYLFLFVGRTSMRGRAVPIDQILVEHFTELGWIHEVTLSDTIVSRRMFSYRVNPATKIKDARTPVENLVVLRKG